MPTSALVLGLGSSGRSAARLLLREGATVRCVDRADTPELRAACATLVEAGATVDFGADMLPSVNFDLCVVSPGVPADGPWVKGIGARGIPVVPEFELGWSRLADSRTIAVTGTNGKSTVVKWIAESLCAAGFSAVPSGNYGTPVCDVALAGKAPDWLVIEASSFQLETIAAFRAEVGVLLNLLPNHLDRHPDFDTYANCKAALFRHTRPADYAVVPAALADDLRLRSGGQCRWLTFGSGAGDFRFEAGHVMCRAASVADLRGTYFDNPVLGVNAAAAVGALIAAGIDPQAAVSAARDFSGLPHRMERVAERRGVRYINDSKATTLTALEAGVNMCGGRVRLIAGGLLKETDLALIIPSLQARVASIYLIGDASARLRKAWGDAVRCMECGDLEGALCEASRDAAPGDTVLLSPGCASFDQFRGYAHRGETFRMLVKRLP